MAEIFREPLKLTTNVHLGIRFSIRHIVFRCGIWVVSQILQTLMTQDFFSRNLDVYFQ